MAAANDATIFWYFAKNASNLRLMKQAKSAFRHLATME
jgi:hypothetical protein